MQRSGGSRGLVRKGRHGESGARTYNGVWGQLLSLECPKTVAVGRKGQGHVPPDAKKGCDFLRHKIYKNSISSVEALMGMEGQIICIEQCTF